MMGSLDPAALSALTNFTPSTTTWTACDLANATICPVLEGLVAGGSTFAVLLFNSQAQSIPASPVLLPVPLGSYAVSDASASPITAQVKHL